jgi:hypothetical protein
MFLLKIYNVDKLKRNDIHSQLLPYNMTGRHDSVSVPGVDLGFLVGGGGAHLQKLRRAEGGAKFFGVFRVKNHIFSNFRGAPPLDPPLVSIFG